MPYRARVVGLTYTLTDLLASGAPYRLRATLALTNAANQILDAGPLGASPGPVDIAFPSPVVGPDSAVVTLETLDQTGSVVRSLTLPAMPVAGETPQVIQVMIPAGGRVEIVVISATPGS